MNPFAKHFRYRCREPHLGSVANSETNRRRREERRADQDWKIEYVETYRGIWTELHRGDVVLADYPPPNFLPLSMPEEERSSHHVGVVEQWVKSGDRRKPPSLAALFRYFERTGLPV